jgi:ferredoxin
LISEQPLKLHSGVLPEKRAYASDFPFRNIGQRDGITATNGGNRSVVSPAYGGFSNVWGAQVMPFAASVFDGWPISAAEMEPHYRDVLNEIPFAGEHDDLAEFFPLIGRPVPLPPTSTRTNRLLAAYASRRGRLNKLGITIGKARLAMAANDCVRCGLCMTGCPYSLIYSASQTFDRLRRSGRIRYETGLLALRLHEDAGRPWVEAREVATGTLRRFEADRVYIACGGIGTTRLVANSLGLFDSVIEMQESRQFTIPFLSAHPTPDPRTEAQFTLNQFNLTVGFDSRAFDLAQLHFYTYNPVFADALPAPLRTRVAGPARRELLRRLSFGIGYLPSWRSPRLSIRIGSSSPDHDLPGIHVSSAGPAPWRNSMLHAIIGRLLRAAPMLDLYPLLPMLRVAAAGKSYHWGGSFPHTDDHEPMLASDRVGRVGGWQRIHLVDGSVFPTVPATTFTLTVMANANRIAAETLELPA